MIKVRYGQIPQAYLDFISKFKDKIGKWINNGYIGNWDTRVELCDECKVIFRYLRKGDNLKSFLLSDSSDHPSIIRYVESRYPELAFDRGISPRDKRTPRSELHKCLYKAFVNLGYNDTDFPNYELTAALCLNACPYCNAEEIIYQSITDANGNVHKIMDSELDHFFPKSRIPYLAACIYNLVPSGKICNGGNGKHDHDTFALQLINPFSLPNSNGFMFAIDTAYKGVLDFSTFLTECKIYTMTPDTSLIPNKECFLIDGRYEKELNKARDVWRLYRNVTSKSYEAVIKDWKDAIGVELSFEEWIDCELDIDCVHYKKKLSKFCMDIWGDLHNTSKFSLHPIV